MMELTDEHRTKKSIGASTVSVWRFQAPMSFGVMAVHISNRYLDLGPVVGATARDAGLVTLVQTHVPSPDQERISAEISPSRWVLLARTVHDFGELARNGRWSTLDDVDGPVWTDDYSNVLGVLRH